jgi:hypothetical protein
MQSNKAYSTVARENKALLAEQQATVRAQAGMDALLRNRILSQTQELGTNLRTAYNTLGPQPIFDKGRLAADYGALKSQGMAELNDLINLTSSQGYARGLDQRGGAESKSIEDFRQTALVKQFAPQVAAVSNTAWGQAIDRASGEMNLTSQNRQNIMGEISNTLTPELKYNLDLFKPSQTSDMATQALGTLASSNVTTAKDMAEKNSALSLALQNVFAPKPAMMPFAPGGVTRAEAGTAGQINWNQPSAFDRMLSSYAGG